MYLNSIRILALAFSIIFSANINGQGIDFFDGSWVEAKTKAEKEGKLIFVDAYAVWCGPCKRMAATVFTNESVGEFMNSKFINLKIDMEKGMGIEFGKEYPVRAFPTLLFIDSKGEVVNKAVGGLGVEDFLKLAEMVMRSYDRSGDFEKEYNEGNRDYELMINYVMALNGANKPSAKIANDYLRMNPDINPEQKATFIYEALNSADSRIFDLFLDHKSLIQDLKGKNEVEKKISQACWKTLSNAIEYSSKELLVEAKSKAKLNLANSNEFIYKADYEYAKALIDIELLNTSAILLAEKILNKDANRLYEVCIELQAFSSIDPTVNTTAEKIIEMALDENESADYMFRYAKILAENNKKKKAMKRGEKARDLALKEKKDTKDIDEFLLLLRSE